MAMQFPGIEFSGQPVGVPLSTVPSAVAVFVGYSETGGAYAMHRVQDFAQYEKILGGPMAPTAGREGRAILHQTVRHYFDNGGGACFVLSVGEYEAMTGITADHVTAALTSPEIPSAIDREPSITLVAVPDLLLLEDSEVDDVAAVWNAILAMCGASVNRFALLDTPATAAATLLCRDRVEPSTGGYGAAFWPHLVTTYTSGNTLDRPTAVIVPPSGAVAALIQASDRALGVWGSPANQPLTNTLAPAGGELEALGLFAPDAVSVNTMSFRRGRGTLLWGSRTLADPAIEGQWIYLQVRRLTSYIEACLSEIASYCVFEPNNEISWQKLGAIADSWMRDLWEAGAFAGEDEADAFDIAIGLGETMTQADVREGRMILRVRFAPKNLAEFIQLALTVNTMEKSTTG